MTIAVAFPPRKGPNHVGRAAAAHVLACAQGKGALPEQILRKLYPKDHDRSLEILTRAATQPATTTTSGWASSLALNDYRDFLIGLQPLSAAARLIELGIPALLGRAQTASYPARAGAPTTVPWVEEGQPIPVTARTLETIVLGPAKTFATICVFTRALADRSDAARVIKQTLSEDAAYTTDAIYFSADSETAARHPGLLNGLSSLTPTAGGGEAALRGDLALLINAVTAGGSGQVVIVTSHSRAATMPVVWPLQTGSLTILGSSAVADTRLIAIDPLSLLHGIDPSPRFDTSEAALVHMEGASPLAIGTVGTPNTVAAPTRSLYQTASIGLRMTASIAFAKRRSNAVAFMDAVTW